MNTARARSHPPRPLHFAVRALLYTALGLAALCSVLPFLFMLLTSLKSYGSVITNTLWPWPPFGEEPFQWQNYAEAIRDIGWDKQWGTWLFVRYFANSVIVTLAVVGGVLFTSIPAAYALARINIPGKNVLFFLVLATIMVPNDLILVPKVVMIFQFKWYNTYMALIVPFLVSVFGIFLLRQFFLQIPQDLFDAAVMDGAGHLRFLWHIALPLCRPAVFTLALLQSIWAWDEFKWPLLVTRDSHMRVLAVGLQQFMIGEGGTSTHLLMAFATMMVVPVIVLYFLTQQYLRESIMTAGLKR